MKEVAEQTTKNYRKLFCDKKLTKQIKGSESSLFVFLITKSTFFFNVY
ncbi:hypothetical protein V12B01_06611 [Vibrio splendidus 12B01]|nr:hypothetical protein V12B01_06611 [Vibrio splendidus 12B01]